jgi:hypothetical protein
VGRGPRSRRRGWLRSACSPSIESRGEDLPKEDRGFLTKSAEHDEKVRLKAELDEKRLQDAELQAALQRAEAAKDREAAAKKITRRTLVGTTGVVAVGGVAGFFGYTSYEAAEQSGKARAALNNQLTDLRNFWTQTGSRDSPTITGGPEETKTAPAIRGSNQGQPTWSITAVRADTSPYIGKGCVVGLVGTGIEISHPAFRETQLAPRMRARAAAAIELSASMVPPESRGAAQCSAV